MPRQLSREADTVLLPPEGEALVTGGQATRGAEGDSVARVTPLSCPAAAGSSPREVRRGVL